MNVKNRKSVIKAISIFATSLLKEHGVSGFTTVAPRTNLVIAKTIKNNYNLSQLPMSQGNKSDGFNLSKPQFDLFSLQSIRNDALLQYNSLNQSEPLRINLCLLSSFILFSYPTLSEAVLGTQVGLFSTVLSTSAGVGSILLFIQECNSRLNQLKRIEKELNAEFLTLKLPTENKFDTSLYGRSESSVKSLKSLRGKKRILALCGSTDLLKNMLIPFRVFRNRLAQAESIVVVVPTDLKDKKVDFNNFGISEDEIRSCQWLAQVQDVESWVSYSQSLINSKSKIDYNTDVIWFGINYNGRSFASGFKDAPSLIELFGQYLPPADFLNESDVTEKTSGIKESNAMVMREILKCQKAFYKALTEGDVIAMKKVFSNDFAQEVSESIEAGGNIDSWESCFAANAAAGMKISECDALIVSSTEAFTTCVEFPVNQFRSTLLASQRWRRVNDEWKIEYHQTIPWSPSRRAGGILRCDSRGCVALTRRSS